MSDVDAYLDSVPEPRRERLQHFMAVIEQVLPEVAPQFWDSGAGMLGYGSYQYEYASGRTGEWFKFGLANRARYISIYAIGADYEDPIAGKFRDRLPGCKLGKACIEVPDRASIDDATLAELVEAVFASYEVARLRQREPGKAHIWE